MLIVGVTGPISSGKGKVAELFREQGFVHHSFSSEIRAVAKERGVEVNRLNLQKLGHALRKEGVKESVLGRRILDKIVRESAKDPEAMYVLEGIRDTDEIRIFRDHALEDGLEFVLIAVDGPQKMRYKLMKKRGRHGDPESFKEFKRIDDMEMHGSIGQEVARCMKLADYMIINDGSFKEFCEKVERVFEEVV